MKTLISFPKLNDLDTIDVLAEVAGTAFQRMQDLACQTLLRGRAALNYEARAAKYEAMLHDLTAQRYHILKRTSDAAIHEQRRVELCEDYERIVNQLTELH